MSFESRRSFRHPARQWGAASFVAVALAVAFAGCGGGSNLGFKSEYDAGPNTPRGGTEEGGGGTDPTGGELGEGEFATDAGRDPTAEGGALYSDARPDVGSDGACSFTPPPPPRLPQKCVPSTQNECDGVTDQTLSAFGVGSGLLNGTGGNGFDDDCDGLVDEGCPCPGAGRTKDCFLVPASQADPVTQAPVGFCAQSSKGSLDCAGAEFPRWSGACRGAQPPYLHDVCAAGDFNCDGVDMNSDVDDCRCKVDPVQCPTAPIVMAPYPNPQNIGLVDGSQWIQDPNQRGNATGWTWTLVGGDCDNVLPHPTFALYAQPNSTASGARRGTRTPVVFDSNATPPRYVATPGAAEASVQAANYGTGVTGGQVYPAFGLSGDYVVQGEFDLNGQHYVCTQKVEVRAPGIRAELCWDTVGSFTGGNDIDLHLARAQGLTCANPGWSTTCSQGTGTSQSYADCWYNSSSGCRDYSSHGPNWGYSNSPDSACQGWASARSATGTQKCTNPRLDRDNISCDSSVEDPTSGSFCGPENINLDNPSNGDRFMVGVTHYSNHGGTSNAHPHVNIYCNGERVLSTGYNPVTGQTSVPLLNQPGTDSTGDYWMVALVTANTANGQLVSCDVENVPSHVADTTRDGQPSAGGTGNGLCVESRTSATSPAGKFEYTNQRFVENAALQQGTNGVPNGAANWCKH